jgi:hypothetical protein
MARRNSSSILIIELMTKIKLYSVAVRVLLQQGYSQIYKFKTSGVSVFEKNEKGNGENGLIYSKCCSFIGYR